MLWGIDDLRFSLWLWDLRVVTRITRSVSRVSVAGVQIFFNFSFWRGDEKCRLESLSFVKRLHLLWSSSLGSQLLLHELLFDLQKLKKFVLIDHYHLICGKILSILIYVHLRNWIWIWEVLETLWSLLWILVDRLALVLSHCLLEWGLVAWILVSEHFLYTIKLSENWIIVKFLDKLFWWLF